MSDALFHIRNYMLQMKAAALASPKPLEQRREEADATMLASVRLPEGAVVKPVLAAGMPSIWVRAAGVPEDCARMVLYYHGGGFFSGSPETHKGFAAEISKAAGARVLLAGYRLAPQHRYPAAHEDALAAYRWLVDTGARPRDIALAGDSAGAMLALATLVALRDAGESPPAAAVLLSPWLDITDYDGESYTTRAALDPMVGLEESKRDAEYYFISQENREQAALLRRDLAGLPPLFIQGGDHELLLSDALRLAERARAAGVDVTHEVWPELWHVFQVLTAILPEANEAVAHIGSFLRERLDIETP